MAKNKANAVQGRKRKIGVFDVVNYIVFILIGIIIIFKTLIKYFLLLF